jgi:hypothetical protein
MLTAADLPPAPAGKAYQLWFIAEGKPPMPGSVFQPDARGHAEMHENIPPEGRTAAVFAVTLEPEGGTSAPTGEMYLKGSASEDRRGRARALRTSPLSPGAPQINSARKTCYSIPGCAARAKFQGMRGTHCG